MSNPENDTDGGAAAPDGARTPPTPEQKRLAAAAVSKLISATVGDVVVVFSRSPAHKHHALSDIEWMVLPPVLAGQVYVAEAAHKDHGARAPVAVVTWAKVSDEVDQKLREHSGTQPIRLRPEEWTSGETYWLIDLVGDRRALAGALQTLRDGPFKDKIVHVAVTDKQGVRQIETLANLAKAADVSASNATSGGAA